MELLAVGEAACRWNQWNGGSRLAELKAVIPAGHEIVMMLRTKDGVRVFTSSKPGDPSWEHEALIPHPRHTSPRTNKSGPTFRASCLVA